MTVYTFTFDPPVAYVDRYGSDCLMSKITVDLHWVSDDDEDRAMLEIIDRILNWKVTITKTITTERTEPLTPPSERKGRKKR